MRAIILAAGQGTRLRPLTNDRPKCMVDLAGTSLLEYQLCVLQQAGVSDISIVTGYREDKIPREGLRHFYNPVYETTNMVVSLFCAEAAMRDDADLLICYGDIIYEPRVLNALVSDTSPISITCDRQWYRYWRLRLDNPLDDAESLILDENLRVLELGNKTKHYENIQGQYMGLIKVRADQLSMFKEAYHTLLASVPEKVQKLFMTAFLEHLINNGHSIQAVMVDNGWLEVDSVEDLELYECLHAQNELQSFCDLAKIRTVQRVGVHPV